MVMPPTNRGYLKRDAVEVPNDSSQPKKRMLFALNTRGLGPLDPPSSPPNGDFHNLNHFRAVRDRDLNVNTTDETHNYTGHTGMRHIMELDDHGGRNHQLLEIHHKLYPITRTVMGKDGLPVKTRNGKQKTVEVMAWKIVSHQDQRRSKGDSGHTYHFGEDCCSTEDICPTIEQARNLGNIVCKILNKYPHNLLKDVKEWDHVQGGRLRLSACLDMDAPAIHEFHDKRMPDNFWFSGDWESDTLTESGRACLRLKGYIIYATVPKKSQWQALHYQNMYPTTTFADTGHAVIDWSEQVYKKLSPKTLVKGLTATTGDSLLAAEFYEMDSSLHAWALKQVATADKVDTGQGGVLVDEVIIRKRQRLLDAFAERGAIVNPSERPDFAGSFMFLQEDVDKPAAQDLGYVDAEDVFQGKATDDRIPQEYSPNESQSSYTSLRSRSEPVFIASKWTAEIFSTRLMMIRTRLSTLDAYPKALVLSPIFNLESFNWMSGRQESWGLTMLEPPQMLASLLTSRLTARPSTLLARPLPTVLWIAIEGSINPRTEPQRPDHWRYLTFNDAEKVHKSQGRRLTAAEYYDGQSWQTESKPARVVWVPLNPMEESVERCISIQQCLVKCFEENTASATADPDSDP
ncbi:hypothetical protein D6C95_02419 [Aureobasidium pullulans]|nr:hypothetical protein D6C95_02419 [Aureobasidium pullulans]